MCLTCLGSQDCRPLTQATCPRAGDSCGPPGGGVQTPLAPTWHASPLFFSNGTPVCAGPVIPSLGHQGGWGARDRGLASEVRGASAGASGKVSLLTEVLEACASFLTPDGLQRAATPDAVAATFQLRGRVKMKTKAKVLRPEEQREKDWVSDDAPEVPTRLGPPGSRHLVAVINPCCF